MDLGAVLAELRRERDEIDAAIRNLERLEHDRPRGPGRPSIHSSNGQNASMNRVPKRLANGRLAKSETPLGTPRDQT